MTLRADIEWANETERRRNDGRNPILWLGFQRMSHGVVDSLRGSEHHGPNHCDDNCKDRLAVTHRGPTVSHRKPVFSIVVAVIWTAMLAAYYAVNDRAWEFSERTNAKIDA